MKFFYLLSKSVVQVEKNASFIVKKNVKIKNSKIIIKKNSKIIIEEGVVLKNILLVLDGEVYIGKETTIHNGAVAKPVKLDITGTFRCGERNRLTCNIWIRFGGELSIGSYTNINEETEIRVDEKVEIGSYNQISYKCVIWDTNTHNMYSCQKRRELAQRYFPKYGYEFEKPETKPISIGDDCWLGREAAILKGVTMGDRCVVGYRTVVSNCTLEENITVVSSVNNKFYKNKI